MKWFKKLFHKHNYEKVKRREFATKQGIAYLYINECQTCGKRIYSDAGHKKVN